MPFPPVPPRFVSVRGSKVIHLLLSGDDRNGVTYCDEPVWLSASGNTAAGVCSVCFERAKHMGVKGSG